MLANGMDWVLRFIRGVILGALIGGLLGCGQGTLQPFTTDGCSRFPDGTPAQNDLWLDCCIAHDAAYWKGGTYQERVEADQALQTCVAKVGQPKIAALMRAGVRAGGSPYWPTSFRWGYGWPYPRPYRALSAQERAQVEKLKPTLPTP